MCDIIRLNGTGVEIKTVGELEVIFGIDATDYLLTETISKESCLCSIDLKRFYEEWPEYKARYDYENRIWHSEVPEIVDQAMFFRSDHYTKRTLSKTYVAHISNGGVNIKQVVFTRWSMDRMGFILRRKFTAGTKWKGWALYDKVMAFTPTSILTIFNFIIPLEAKRLELDEKETEPGETIQ